MSTPPSVPPPPGRGRRSFLRTAGTVLLAGVGLGAAATTAHAAPQAHGASPAATSGRSTAQACAEYCYVKQCNKCGSGCHQFECFSNCRPSYLYNVKRACSGFCRYRNSC